MISEFVLRHRLVGHQRLIRRLQEVLADHAPLQFHLPELQAIRDGKALRKRGQRSGHDERGWQTTEQS